MDTEEVLWEVWRSHGNGLPDVRLQGLTSEEHARRVLQEAVDDSWMLSESIEFYLVKVTLHREILNRRT